MRSGDTVAIAIADGYDRTTRDFDSDGPHIVTGLVFVEGAQPGDVLKIETLASVPRVPYGVVSSRHGKGEWPQPVVPETRDHGTRTGVSTRNNYRRGLFRAGPRIRHRRTTGDRPHRTVCPRICQAFPLPALVVR